MSSAKGSSWKPAVKYIRKRASSEAARLSAPNKTQALRAYVANRGRHERDIVRGRTVESVWWLHLETAPLTRDVYLDLTLRTRRRLHCFSSSRDT